MTQKVSFTAMEHGTREDYELIATHDRKHASQQADRVLQWLRDMDGESPYRISRLDHCLQTATRAARDGADDETVVCALLHDVGDLCAPDNHGAFAAALLAPYVSERNRWVVQHHEVFQGYYYFHHWGRDRNAREAFRGHPHFDACAAFCERWDQVSFDPAYDTLPIEAFEPAVHRIFTREPRKSGG